MTLCDSCPCVTHPTNYKFVLTSCNTHSLALIYQPCIKTSADHVHSSPNISELETDTLTSEVEVNKHVLL